MLCEESRRHAGSSPMTGCRFRVLPCGNQQADWLSRRKGSFPDYGIMLPAHENWVDAFERSADSC